MFLCIDGAIPKELIIRASDNTMIYRPMVPAPRAAEGALGNGRAGDARLHGIPEGPIRPVQARDRVVQSNAALINISPVNFDCDAVDGLRGNIWFCGEG